MSYDNLYGSDPGEMASRISSKALGAPKPEKISGKNDTPKGNVPSRDDVDVKKGD